MASFTPKVPRWANRLVEVANSNPGVARVVLKRGKAQIFENGNPMVYSGAIDRVVGRPPPKTGDVVLVTNGAEAPIAWGVFNSVSMFRVRVLQTEDEAQRDPNSTLNVERLIESRISAAIRLRSALSLPSSETDVYRLINSEGDRLSGLVVDVFGDHIVVASSAAWVEKCRPTLEATLKRLLEKEHLTWRPSVELLKEEGLEYEAPEESSTSKQAQELSSTSKEAQSQVRENGILFNVALSGQKTGFYVDQRDNRLLLRSLCKHKTVLDLCCYSGGFSLNAAKAGAFHVTGVDSSRAAVELAKSNAELNGFDEEKIEFHKADIVQFMRSSISEERNWDVVVLDPPKLAPNRRALEKAAIKYRSLNSMAMQLVKSGGLLMTCSCSGAMTQSQSFLSTIQEAAKVANRKVLLLRDAGASPDHPIDLAYPEGNYLKNYLFQCFKA